MTIILNIDNDHATKNNIQGVRVPPHIRIIIIIKNNKNNNNVGAPNHVVLLLPFQHHPPPPHEGDNTL
eukprot:CAMPEP_0171015912 /NCGR_PEP_ID=MMETSP0736-20130129/26296_1 /TAXON_ID=186038 /ORGANISM="Fragilariopsis kerguelensis, Strain L26-C5" /LENGTH=67 /DNA_ID=CAMNT_0011451001 /DNA_START=21 /DNA_END=221 /DNA_ORIENTATION=+